MDFLVKNAANSSNESNFEGMQVGTANIKVIGCGGAGSNAVNWLYKKGIRGAEIVACNTDLQHLQIVEADRKILIGKDKTRGLGAGGYPEVGLEAAKEASSELKDALKGTGSAPYIAGCAKDMGAIVIGTVTMPFKIERARVDKAEFGLQQLRRVSDTVIVIDNNKLVQIAGDLPIQQAFAVANELIATMIKGIVETIAVPSLVNLDYADVKAIMTNGGVAAIGVGSSDTANRVEEAVNGALSNPLLDISYEGATGALLHIHGGPDLTLEEINRVGELVTNSMDADANCIWGARVTDEMKGKLIVMTIITGVKSPYIVGKVNEKQHKADSRRISDDLGIEIVR
jgi:cell division protein FtsZ